MAGPYPLPTLAPTITSAGITAPSYSDVLSSLQAEFLSIYGADAYIAPDSQDGQLLAVFAKAISDQNAVIISVFQSFSPAYAQGTELSALVRINGISRLVATNSSAVCTVVGTVGTVISSGVAQDTSGNLWNLPSSVTIPLSGSISVTVTAQQAGNIVANANTITTIYTPQLGWASITNPAAAVPGAAVETDAQLRIRQALSVALPALTPLQSIAAAIAALPGVTRSLVYENPTAVTDGNGVPSHSIDVIVQGGSLTQIAQTIEATKSPGTGTYGATNEVVTDPSGFPLTINFDVLALTAVYVSLTIKALPTYVGAPTTAMIQAAVSAFVDSLQIGEEVYYSQVQAAAQLIGLPQGQTFYVVSMTTGYTSSPSGTTNLPIAFNAAANCPTANVVVTVT
jgi:uncharacterized phage protein gp47/JayE